jgi:polar amino acid transport system substrate-binding protein
LATLFDSVAAKRADLAIAAISVTAERSAKFDFSQPIFESGLQILTRTNANAGPSGFGGVVKAALSPQVRGLLALLFSVIFVLAHVVWFFDRRHDETIKPYFPGIFRAAYWASGAAGGQQPFAPHSPFARMLGVMCVFLSVIILAYFTATVTSAMTIEELQGAINGPDDLPGKRVATISNSTSAAYLREAHVQARDFQNIDAAYAALLSAQVDAVVYDSPTLLYFAANAGKGKVNAVGPVFHHEAYGILYAPDSPLRRPVDAALLKLRENGAYSALYQKWFHAGD